MGLLRYFFEAPIPLSRFQEGLDKSPLLNHQTNYRPPLPFVRIWLDDLRMVAQTNCDREIACLRPLDAYTERHLQLAEGIAALFNMKIEVDDWRGCGSALKFLNRAELDKPDRSERYGFPPLVRNDGIEEKDEQDFENNE